MKFATFAIVLLSSFVPMAAQPQQLPDNHTVVKPEPKPARPLWLGMSLKSTTTTGEPGVEVTRILRRSPADGTGVKRGDRITHIGEVAVDSTREVRAAVNTHAAGDIVAVKLVRAAREQVIKFPVQPMPDPNDIMRAHLLGFPAPPFKFRYVGDNKASSLEALRGKPTVIDFWATWCGPCHDVQLTLGTLTEKYGDKINVLGVSDESVAVIREYLNRRPASYAMATDTTSRLLYAVHSIPLVLLLDAEHRVVSVLLGVEELGVLDAQITNLLK